ncbi:MAG: zinc ABC transporter substrate-binding protein [Candidatus Aureabacteria bacterium]|nr:zinc ABC transporter substrate-binding protein [Candidatus Auribacterota bacterium]
MKAAFLTALLAAFFVFVLAAAAGETRIPVITTILPYKEFIEAVGGERVVVSVLIPPGANPHAFELTPEGLKKAAAAKLYVKAGSGIEFELVWADKIISQRSGIAVCDSSRGIALLGEEEAEGEHGHHPGGKDPHVWLSPSNSRRIVENIRDCLIALAPEHADEFRANAEKYGERLAALDRELQALFSPRKDRALLVFHPSWGYFARDYGLEQIAIEAEGKEPSPRSLARLIETTRRKGIRTVFISPQTSDKTARAVAEALNARVAIADPLAGDYLDNLRNFGRAAAEGDLPEPVPTCLPFYPP